MYHIALAIPTPEGFSSYCRDGYRRRLITKATHVTLFLSAALTVPASALANATSAGSEALYLTNIKERITKCDTCPILLALSRHAQTSISMPEHEDARDPRSCCSVLATQEQPRSL